MRTKIYILSRKIIIPSIKQMKGKVEFSDRMLKVPLSNLSVCIKVRRCVYPLNQQFPLLKFNKWTVIINYLQKQKRGGDYIKAYH